MSSLLTRHPVALSHLFNETLFNIPDERLSEHTTEQKKAIAAAPPEQSKKEILFKGENRKKILFFVNDFRNAYFSKEAEDAFQKTLRALGLSIPDVTVINLKSNAHSIQELVLHFDAQFIIGLGVELGGLAKNEVKESNGKKYLSTFSFDEMLEDVNSKKVFWNAIQILKNN